MGVLLLFVVGGFVVVFGLSVCLGCFCVFLFVLFLLKEKRKKKKEKKKIFTKSLFMCISPHNENDSEVNIQA